MVTERNALEYAVTLKKAFVEKHLAPMLRAAVGKIKSVEYTAMISADGMYTEAETVTISFKDGGTKEVNVGREDCLHIAKEVLERFN